MAFTTEGAAGQGDPAVHSQGYRGGARGLRTRIAATRCPENETVSDRTQGAQLAKVQELVDYWATDYDWRKLEAKFHALPQFITEIDGLDIHFIHVRSPHANACRLS